jgi:hypothetical protein
MRGGKGMRNSFKIFALVAGLLVMAVLFVLIALGVAVERGFVPDTCIVMGKTLKEKHTNVARSVVPFEEGETLVWLYAGGLLDYAENLQFMTDRRIVSAWEEDEKPRTAQLRLSDLRKVRVMKEPSWLDDGIVLVSGENEDDGFLLNLSGEDGLHKQVIEQLKSHIPREKPPGTPRAEAEPE